jgi:CRISPR-associated protein Cas1
VSISDEQEPSLRVNALHALLYCERLFYLEEVEELYRADDRVYAGRRLHDKLARQQSGGHEHIETLTLESPSLGLRGKIDCLKSEKGNWVPYEHKRGRSLRKNGQPTPWPSDRVQVLAYALLAEDCLGGQIEECRVRYHEENVLVHIPLDEEGRQEVRRHIERAKHLRQSTERPPVTENEKLCVNCALAPVCLPEEARLSLLELEGEPKTRRFFPADDSRQVHITNPEYKIGRSGNQLKVSHIKGEQPDKYLPVESVGQVVLHGFSQISTQAMAFCAEQDIGVHLLSGGGRYIGSFSAGPGSVQRRIRQYRALCDPDFRLSLSRRVVSCHGENQRQVLMRYQRNLENPSPQLRTAIDQMAGYLKTVDTIDNPDTLRGIEGNLANLYFQSLPLLIGENIPQDLHPNGRNRRPPLDRYNALLSFGYSLLLKDVLNAVLVVGLEPALGFYHQPRSQAQPLVLDLIEIFRVPLVDIPVLNSINRQQWDINTDFSVAGRQVWLSDAGRKKWLDIYERRKQETWKHAVVGYSLTYSRLMELEVRLLEKEWMNEGGLFARMRLR